LWEEKFLDFGLALWFWFSFQAYCIGTWPFTKADIADWVADEVFYCIAIEVSFLNLRFDSFEIHLVTACFSQSDLLLLG